jgi:hypothetical protein
VAGIGGDERVGEEPGDAVAAEVDRISVVGTAPAGVLRKSVSA